MSIPKRMTISCPHCKNQFDVTVFESLNTDFAPDIIETVISGDRFRAKCPHCGFIAHLEYVILYHDMKHGAMIWVIHNNKPEYAKKIAEIRSSYSFPNDITRIVPNMAALCEKAACLASGKDDRVVEICKVFLVSQLNQQKPNFNFKNAFYTYRDGKNIVCFYDINGEEIRCDLDDKVYNMIFELFKKPLLQMEKAPYQIIDYDWAVDFFKNLPDEDEIEEGTDQSKRTDVPKAANTLITNTPAEDFPKRKAMFCRKCGAKLLSDSLFCSYCGTKVIY